MTMHYEGQSVGRRLLLLVSTLGVLNCQYQTTNAFRPLPTTAPTSRTLSTFLVTSPTSAAPSSCQFRNGITNNKQRQLLSLQATSSQTSSRRGRPYRLMIVESPSKVKTIEKILQEHVEQHDLPYDFVVTSCKGHIRDLPKKKGKGGRRKKKDTDNVDETQSTSTFPYKIPGINLENNYEPTYEIIPEKQTVVQELCRLAEGATRVLLATDPDREGEAMAWHLMQVLSDYPGIRFKGQDDSFYQRVSFTEITRTALVEALESKHMALSSSLVQAQETRRILDRLAGFTVSPLLWKKIAPGLSAGRVQSVGMALVVQRERERLLFESTPYGSLEALLHTERQGGNEINARLYSVNGTVVAASGDDFSSQGRQLKPQSMHKLHMDIDSAKALADYLDEAKWKVVEVKSTRRQRSPQLPYRTSTLQQDASRKLGMSVSDCMRAAQQLYEQGWISYMRTDSSTLSEDAEGVVRSTVVDMFGKSEYQPQTKAKGSKASTQKKEAKFAQEAHEAIRPAIQNETGLFFAPDVRSPGFVTLPDSCQRVYRLIYQRTLASRMSPLVTNQTTIQIEATRETTSSIFRASGSVVIHKGYTKAYEAPDLDDEGDDFQAKLPSLDEGELLGLSDINAIEHETRPPARYTEASFVKELETLGVGRPSTYASIVKILRDRAYVGNPLKPDQSPGGTRKALQGSAISAHRAAGGDTFRGRGGRGGPLVPSLPAFVVTSLLEKHCPSYVDPAFTAQMEERLDKIALDEINSDDERIAYLDEFYAGDEGLAAVVKRVDDELEANSARRAILPALESCGPVANDDDGEVGLFVGPWGPYVQRLAETEEKSSASLPPDMCADLSTITPKALRTILSTKLGGGLVLGSHPEDGRPIRLMSGRYGSYLKWGEEGEPNTTTHSLPREKSSIQAFQAEAESSDLGDTNEHDVEGRQPCLLTFEEAVGYVSLPRVCGHMNDTTPILAGLGPYGPYVKVNSTYASLNKRDGDVLTVDEETAVRLVLAAAHKPRGSSRGVLVELGQRDGKEISIKQGRFGPYVTWNKYNAGLPRDLAAQPEEVTLEEAWALLEPKVAAGPRPKSKKGKGTDPSLPPPPKRPKNAYMHFCAEKRQSVVSESGGKMSIGEVSKELSRLWANTDEEDRAKYKELVEQEKREYAEKYAEWVASCKEITGQHSKRTKNKKTATRKGGSKAKEEDLSLPVAPKRPKNAYMHFCAEKRSGVVSKAGGKMSIGEVAKELSQLWADTNEVERAKYKKLADQEKAEYAGKYAKWEASCQEILRRDLPSSSIQKKRKTVKKAKTIKMPSIDSTELGQSLVLNAGPPNGKEVAKYGPAQRSKLGTKKERLPPIKRPRSAYLFFCESQRPEVAKKCSTFGETTKELARLWAQTLDRSSYQALAEADLQRYRKQKEERMCAVGCDCC